MARALKNSEIEPTYLEFFGMTRPPFSQLPIASQIFHSEQYSLLMAHLASATKQADCLMIICGADGSGKTTLLNRYITSLSEETTFATFDETCPDGTEFYCAFLRQLGFHDITGTLHELRRITREFLIHRGKAQDPVLLIMDNAHLVSPTILEQLRWISETKVDDRRVLSVVLAGNADLPRIMESPAMKSMKFRTQVDFNIRVFSEEETEDYVRHRLRLADGVDAAKFSNEAHPLIYRFSGGIPSVINMLCNEVLAEACTQETRVITEELIRTVADRNRLEPNVFRLPGQGRRKTDPDFKLETSDRQGEERITVRAAPVHAVGTNAATEPGSSDLRFGKLQTQLANLKTRLQEMEAERRKTKTGLSERDQEIAKLRTQLDRKMRETEMLSATASQVGELQQELLAKTQESEILAGAVQEIEDLRLQLSEKNRKLEDMSGAVDEAATLRDELKSKTRDLKKLQSTADKVAPLEEQLAEKDDEIARLAEAAGELDGLRKRVSEQAQEVEKLALVGAEIGDLREQLAAKSKDSAALSSTTAEIDVLRNQLETKTHDIEKMNSAAIDDAHEIDQLNKALTAKANALADGEEQVKSLSRDLKKEQRAAGKALAIVSKLEKRIEKLDSTKSELRQKVSDVGAELKSAKKEVSRLEPLENELSSLRERTETQATELQDREERVAELETLLKVALDECEELRAGSSAAESIEQMLTEKDTRIAILEAELASYCHLNTTNQPSLDEEQFENIVDVLEENEASANEDEQSAQEDEAAANKDEQSAKEDEAPVEEDSPLEIDSTDESSFSMTAIEIIRSGQVEQVVDIADMPSRVMIGRGDDSDLRLDSKFVSRHHALLFSSANGLFIEDLNSFNGTVVNSRKIVRCELHPEDKVVVGDYQLRPV